MTRREFSENYAHFMRAGARQGILIICPVLIMMEVTLGILACRFDWAGSSLVVLGGIMFVCFLAGVILWDRSAVKKCGLCCPTCERRLVSADAHRKLLLTGNCPKCGNKVFEGESFSPASGYLDREEFNTRLTVYKRQRNRESIRLLIFLFAMMAACVPIAKYFQRLVDSGGLDWVTLTQWKWFAGMVLAAVCVMAVGIFILASRGKF